MNEKIRELALQARAWVNDTDNVAPDIEYVFYKDAYDKKFAELIVAECIDIVKPTDHHEVWAQSYLGGVDGLELLEDKCNKIKQHFGIEL